MDLYTNTLYGLSVRALTEGQGLYTNPRGQKSKELSKRAFQQVRTYGSLRFKGIVALVSDHGSTALAVTYIGYGFKNPTNLGLLCAERTGY